MSKELQEIVERAVAQALERQLPKLQADDVWLKAATLWEIGLRGLRDFRGELQKYLNSKDPMLKETAELVMSRI